MKLHYTPPGGIVVDLHELGDIYILSQQSQFTPEDLPQKETRTVQVRIDVSQDTYQANYALIEQVRTALKKSTGKLKWTDERPVDEDGVPTGADPHVYLDQVVVITAVDFPEEPNAWGTYNQAIGFTFKYDIHDGYVGTNHQTVTFQANGEAQPITLGNVFTLKKDYKSKYYSDLKNIRERASGTISLTGELQCADITATIALRRQNLLEKLQAMDTAVNKKDGVLTYGNFITGKTVRVDAWVADIDQEFNKIKWSLTVSYTEFPNEAGYAAAEIRVAKSEDKESGEWIMSISGKIGATNESTARAKLDTVRTSLLTGGWTSNQCVRADSEANLINADDGEAFIELTFSEAYRRRMGTVLSYSLTINDNDDLRSGLITRSYSGWVVSSGASDDLAYAAALAQAQTLGDAKHPLKLSSRVSRVDRKLNSADKEHVRVEFSYDYQLKGTKLYIEYTSELAYDNFGENSERVQGFVVAADATAAATAYATSIRTAFNSRIVRNESLSQPYQVFKSSVDGTTDTTMWIRMDFSFTAFKAKSTGTFNVQYGMEVDIDFVALRKVTTVSGTVVADATKLTAIQDGTAGNDLDTFLAGLSLGKLVNTRRNTAHLKVGSSLDEKLACSFSNTYIDSITTTEQVLALEVSERIVHSGTRWVMQPVPDGPDVAQNCGTKSGTRTVTGSVTAGTEAAARLIVKSMSELPFYGSTPATRYTEPPELQINWEVLPMTTLTGRGTNATFCKIDFAFSETLVNYAYPD